MYRSVLAWAAVTRVERTVPDEPRLVEPPFASGPLSPGVVPVVKVLQAGLGHVRVDLGRRQVRVPQQHLDDAQVRAVVEHVRGEGVAKLVRRQARAETEDDRVVADPLPDGLAGQAATASRNEDLLVRVPYPIASRPVHPAP